MRTYRHVSRVLVASTLAVAGFGLSGPVLGAQSAKKSQLPQEAFYRCRDARGHQHLGQSIPAECMDLDVEILDDRGRVIRIVPGRLSLEEEARRKAEAEAAEAEREAFQQRDRTLLATYLSVADIERLRDQRLELLQQQAEVTRQYIANLREREGRLIEESRRFRPYSDKQNAPALPENLAEEIVSTVNGLQVYEQQLAKNTTEQSALSVAFDADITRFKELKGIK
jgi:hypothetical protein